jgi:ankyrin repeat protein
MEIIQYILGCRWPQSQKFVLSILRCFPQAATQPNRHGKYPLHIACKNQSENNILTLLMCFPQAASKSNKKGNYPLHILHVNGSNQKKFC